MEKKALYNLSYGVFMLSTRSGEKVNGCITNTCMQVANDPVRIAISVLNSNYQRKRNFCTESVGCRMFL